jgi:hypothetical protein
VLCAGNRLIDADRGAVPVLEDAWAQISPGRAESSADCFAGIGWQPG